MSRRSNRQSQLGDDRVPRTRVFKLSLKLELASFVSGYCLQASGISFGGLRRNIFERRVLEVRETTRSKYQYQGYDQW